MCIFSSFTYLGLSLTHSYYSRKHVITARTRCLSCFLKLDLCDAVLLLTMHAPLSSRLSSYPALTVLPVAASERPKILVGMVTRYQFRIVCHICEGVTIAHFWSFRTCLYFYLKWSPTSWLLKVMHYNIFLYFWLTLRPQLFTSSVFLDNLSWAHILLFKLLYLSLYELQ